MKLITYNNFCNLFGSIALAHKQIHQFGVGEMWEINGQPKTMRHFPVFWVVPTSLTAREQTLDWGFRLLCFDQPHKDEHDENEILSDTAQILIDVIKILKQQSNDYTLTGDPVLEPFTENFDDEVSGWSCEVTVQTMNTTNYCDIPADLNLISDEGVEESTAKSELTAVDITNALVSVADAVCQGNKHKIVYVADVKNGYGIGVPGYECQLYNVNTLEWDTVSTTVVDGTNTLLLDDVSDYAPVGIIRLYLNGGASTSYTFDNSATC